MTDQQIVAMLKSPAKPRLEEAKKYCLENAGAFGVNAVSANDWHEAGNESAAQAMITRKYFPDRTKKTRESFYRSYNYSKVENEMRKAGVEAWQASLPATDKNKHLPWQTFQFYLSVHLGSGQSYSRTQLYDGWLHWERRQKRAAVWASMGDIGINEVFLYELSTGSATARKLAEFGYQNVVTIEGHVIFIKLPKRVSLEMVRGAWRLSDATGPARVSAGGDKQYFYRGVQFLSKPMVEEEFNRWDRRRGSKAFDECFENGKIKLNPKEALNLPNVEQRRVIMESYEPEAILESCDAKRIGDKSELGNELFSVDVGVPEGSVWDHVKRVQVPVPSRQKMLRYECPSTGRVYAKFVPPEMQTADEAQAWSHHYTLEEYKKIKQQS